MKSGSDTAMSVYLVHGDVEKFQSLVLPLSDEEFAALPDLAGYRVADRWPMPPVHVENELAPEPDIWHLSTLSKSFAMSRDVIERLEPFISSAGELLPLRAGDSTVPELFALNILDPLDVHVVIDVAASDEERGIELASYKGSVPQEEYDAIIADAQAGDPWPALYPAFIAGGLREASTFFKINRLPGSVFLLDRTDEGDTLLRRINRFAVTGLRIIRVWSSETGPERVNLFRV